MAEKKKKHLGTSLTITSIIFALCICIVMGSIGFTIYSKSTKKQYQKYLSGEAPEKRRHRYHDVCDGRCKQRGIK